MKSNKGFTLIELLVVISIIGVISSVIFVSFQGSRDKAKLAKAQQFDANISHALGAYAVGIWRFEDISGGEVLDESGYGNDGTAVNSPSLVDSEIYAGTKALEFDGSNYVSVPHSSSLNITDAITIEAWVKPAETQIDHATPISKGGVYKIRLHNNIVYCGSAGGICYGTSFTYTDDQWTHIVWTFSNVVGDVITYKNGVQQTPVHCGGNIGLTGNPLVIGADSAGSRYFNGSIDNVAIYNEALSSAQIQQHYAAGAPFHGITLK